MRKGKQSQKGSGIIAFIVIPLVISAVVMVIGAVSGPRETPVNATTAVVSDGNQTGN